MQLAAESNFQAMDVSFFAARLYRNLQDDAESDALVALKLFEAWQEVCLCPAPPLLNLPHKSMTRALPQRPFIAIAILLTSDVGA